jgi:hypothetical protein
VKSGSAVILLICLFREAVIARFNMRPTVFVTFTIMRSIRGIGRNAKSVNVILGKKSLNECLKIG